MMFGDGHEEGRTSDKAKAWRLNHPKRFAMIIVVLAAIVALDVTLSASANYFCLSETETMYLLSSIPQVVAAFAGLTVAGYSIVEGALHRQVEADDSLMQIIESMRKRFRALLMEIIVAAVVDIVVCFYGIVSFPNQNGESDFFYRLVLNSSAILLLVVLFLISVLVWEISNPNTVQNLSNAAVKEINRGQAKPGNLEEFIKTFNLLSENLVEKATDAGYKSSANYVSTMAATRYLMRIGYFPKRVFRQLSEIIRYRNYLVHGTDMAVSDEMLNELRMISHIVSTCIEKGSIGENHKVG